MNRASTQVLWTSLKLRSKKRCGQAKTQKNAKSVIQIKSESAIVIQRWWRKIRENLDKSEFVTEILLTPYEQVATNINPELIQSFISELEINEEVSIDERSSPLGLATARFSQEYLETINSIEKPKENLENKENQNIFDMSFKSKFKENRAEKLLQFLDESENSTTILNNVALAKTSRSDSQSYLVFVNYKIELEEANKTIESLKEIIQTQKTQLKEKEIENQLIDQEKIKYEEITDKNVLFMEELLKEKEQRIKQLNELNLKVKEMEEIHSNTIKEITEKFQSEMLEKEELLKNNEEKWINEKSKEIINSAIKSCEEEHIKNIKELKEEHHENMQKTKAKLELEYQEKLKEVQNLQNEKINLEKNKILSHFNDELRKEKEKLQEEKKEIEIHFQEKVNLNDQEWMAKFQEAQRNANILLEEQENLYRVKINQLRTIYENEKLQFQESSKSQDLSIKEKKKIEEYEIAIEKLSNELKDLQAQLKLEKDAKEKIVEDRNLKILELEMKINRQGGYKDSIEFVNITKRAKEQEVEINKLNYEKSKFEENNKNLMIEIENIKRSLEELKSNESNKNKTIIDENNMLKEQIKILKEYYEARIAEITQKEAEEFEVIEERVWATINKKDEKIRELQEQLKILSSKLPHIDL
ncbi:unnamed protein product [Blepharisma stoltei]|uniref:Uncharacterized protein n=1 Tax=Blepharisma stoltei TaxID=1481888 RepID=A0AAU9JTN5_9CILI|nr:unnamed protein product [Blepharisma stoltei]